MKLRYTPRALDELDDILDYVRQRSPHGATRGRSRLLALTRLIQERPYSGRKTSERGLRRVVATPYPYIVFYEATEDGVVIVGVRHGARDPRTMPGADDAPLCSGVPRPPRQPCTSPG